MGTIVAARTSHGTVIASDCLNTFEEVVHSSLNHAESCITKMSESFIGLNCSYALQQLIQTIFEDMSAESISEFHLSNKEQIRSFFSSLFLHLKNQYQIIPQQSPHLPIEILPLNALVVNRHGIFKVDGSRSVYEHKKYWATGTGEAFALGALHATYNDDADAETLVRAALKACGSFEANRNREIFIKTIRLPNLKLARPEKTKESTTKATVLMHRGPVSIRRGRKNKKKEPNPEQN